MPTKTYTPSGDGSGVLNYSYIARDDHDTWENVRGQSLGNVGAGSWGEIIQASRYGAVESTNLSAIFRRLRRLSKPLTKR